MPGLLHPVIYGAQSFVIRDLSGKVMIVTGGSSGLGLHTIIHLVRAGAKVYMAARSETKVKAALAQIAKMDLPGQVIWLRVDMTDFQGIRTAALEFSAKERHLDVLFLNAGITGPNKATVDDDGLELTIKTNHYGPFLFTHLLLSKFQKSAEPRIVLTASMYYKYFKATPTSFSSVAEVNQVGTRTGQRYSQSKLSNVLFAVQASKEWPNILTNACHPGFVATDMLQAVGTRYGGSLGMMLMKGFLFFFGNILGVILLPAEGSLTQLYLGTSDEVAKQQVSGEYFVPIAQHEPKAGIASVENAQRLWQTTRLYFEQRDIKLAL